MSLLGLLRHRGAIADVFRPTTADGAGGLVNVTWPSVPVSSNVRVLPDVIADELAQKLFGREAVVDVRLVVPLSVDVQKDDGVAIRTGEYAGQRFRVTAAVPQTVRGRSQHREVAAERTTEVFG